MLLIVQESILSVSAITLLKNFRGYISSEIH